MYEEDLFYSDDRFLLATLQMSKLIPTSFHSLGIVVSSMRYIRRIFFIAITHRVCDVILDHGSRVYIKIIVLTMTKYSVPLAK